MKRKGIIAADATKRRKRNIQFSSHVDLFKAAREGDLQCLEQADWQSILSTTNKHGSSVLHFAAGSGQADIVDYLLKSGFPADACAKNGRCALHWAARNGHNRICESLVVKYSVPVDVKAAGEVTPLQLAVWQGHLSTAKLLTNLGADPLMENGYGCSVAHWLALCPCYAEAAKQQDELGRKTCAQNMEELFSWLRNLGVNFVEKNHHNQTPLHKAAYAGNIPVIKLLVRVSGQIDDKQDTHGNFAQDCAYRNNMPHAAHILRQIASPALHRSLQILGLDMKNTGQVPEPAVVRKKFLALARICHPDVLRKGGESTSVDMNSLHKEITWQKLKDAKDILMCYFDNYVEENRLESLRTPDLRCVHRNENVMARLAILDVDTSTICATAPRKKSQTIETFRWRLATLLRSGQFRETGVALSQLPRQFQKNWQALIPKQDILRHYRCRKLAHALKKMGDICQVEYNRERNFTLLRLPHGCANIKE